MEGSISTTDLPSLVLGALLIVSFGEETISDDDYVQHYDDVSKLSSNTDCDSGSICY